MENSGGLLLACVLLLALAITGPRLSVDARMAAEWTIPNKNDADRPMNLTRNSVGPRFEVQGDDKSAQEDGEGAGLSFSLPPGFGTVVTILRDVHVQCQHNFPNPTPPLLVDEVIHPGNEATSFLADIDSNSSDHVSYQCIWTTLGPNQQYTRATVWADDNHQDEMPLSCVYCLWRADALGIYLHNDKDNTFQFVSHWCYPDTGC